MSGGFGDDGFSGDGFDPDDSAQENVDKYYTYTQTSGGGGNGGGRGISIGGLIIIVIVGFISNPVAMLALIFFGLMAVVLILDIRDARKAAKQNPNEDEQSTHNENKPD